MDVKQMSISTQKKCTAKSKRNGKQCQGLAMPNGKCRVHGGKSLSGADSPNFKHGKFSKVLNGLNLAQDYEDALSNDRLHHCRNEIALMDSLLSSPDLLPQLNGEFFLVFYLCFELHWSQIS